MSYIARVATLLVLSVAAVNPCAAADPTPALAFDTLIKDGGFNEGAFAGAERFRTETKIDFRYQVGHGDNDEERVLTTLATGGLSPIIAISFAYADAVKAVAPRFPNTKFVIIDGVVDAPNVQSIVFKEQEGSFLVGALAAMVSKTGHIGFVGGMDIPIIHRFGCGYLQGAKAVNAGVTVSQDMIGPTPAAWRDVATAATLANKQITDGADVLFAAAGFAGKAVLETAVKKDKLAIGVDSNQNGLFPGHILTSMVKRMDVVTYDALMAAKNGTWTAGLTERGLADGGIGWALDDANRPLVDAATQEKVEGFAKRISSKEIKVVDYMAGNACPL